MILSQQPVVTGRQHDPIPATSWRNLRTTALSCWSCLVVADIAGLPGGHAALVVIQGSRRQNTEVEGDLMCSMSSFSGLCRLSSVTSSEKSRELIFIQYG